VRRTYYEVLGVAQTATDAELRSAYRKLVLKYHPDRSNAPDANDRLIEATLAHEALSDPVRRKAYDDVLAMERALGVQKSTSPQKPPPQPRPRPARPATAGSDAVRLAAMFARGRIAEAERLARKMIAEDQRDPMPYAVLGDIARFRGELRKAAEQYAYAAQMDPTNSVYQRKHEEVLRALGRDLSKVPSSHGAKAQSAAGSSVGAVVTTVGCTYVVLAVEQPMAPDIGLVSTWTLGLVSMLFLSGLSIGAGLSVGGMVERFNVMHGALATRLSPSVVLGVVAAFNFWAAAGLYLFIGASQRTMNVSTSRAVGLSAVALLAMTAACFISQRIDPLQTLLWGGNLVYLGTLCGWMVADAFRE
jgi:curved DNA-binding protein CbpA